MSLADFADSRSLSLGVELELQLVNATTTTSRRARDDMLRLMARHAAPGHGGAGDHRRA